MRNSNGNEVLYSYTLWRRDLFLFFLACDSTVFLSLLLFSPLPSNIFVSPFNSNCKKTAKNFFTLATDIILQTKRDDNVLCSVGTQDIKMSPEPQLVLFLDCQLPDMERMFERTVSWLHITLVVFTWPRGQSSCSNGRTLILRYNWPCYNIPSCCACAWNALHGW